MRLDITHRYYRGFLSNRTSESSSIKRAISHRLRWAALAEQHLIDPRCIEFLAGVAFELITTANVSELADSRPGDEREQIRRLAGLSSETEVSGTPWDATLPKPHVFEPGSFDIEAYIQWLKKSGQ